MKLKRHIQFLNESNEYERSVDSLRKFGMLDYSELPMKIQSEAKQAGLFYEESWPGLDGFGIKNYTNTIDANGNNVHDYEFMIVVGATYGLEGMDTRKFDKDTNITVYVSGELNDRETGFHVIDDYTTPDNVSKFLRNMSSIMDNMHCNLEESEIKDLLTQFGIDEDSIVVFKN